MGLLSYIQPQKGQEKKTITAPDISNGRLNALDYGANGGNTVAATPMPALDTPGMQTPVSWSRPPSLNPSGDARSLHSEDINEMKADVVVNWLHQQQMERLWTSGAGDEGVVLKKSKGSYTCCPSYIINEPQGFFEAIQAINVRVFTSPSNLIPTLHPSTLTCRLTEYILGGNDSQHASHQALPP